MLGPKRIKMDTTESGIEESDAASMQNHCLCVSASSHSLCQTRSIMQVLNSGDLSWIASNLTTALEVEKALKSPPAKGYCHERITSRFRALSADLDDDTSESFLIRLKARRSIETLLFSLSDDDPASFQPCMQAVRRVLLWTKHSVLKGDPEISRLLFSLLNRLLRQFPPRTHFSRLFWLYAFADDGYRVCCSDDGNENIRRLVDKFRSRIFRVFSLEHEDDMLRCFLVDLFEWDLCAVVLQEDLDEREPLSRFPLCLLLHFDVGTEEVPSKFSRASTAKLAQWLQSAVCAEHMGTRLAYVRLVEMSVEALRLSQMGFRLESLMKAEVPSLAHDRIADVELLIRSLHKSNLNSADVAKLFITGWMKSVAAKTVPN